MAEGYETVSADDLLPGMVILIEPGHGKHRKSGAIPGNSHLYINSVEVVNLFRGYVEIKGREMSLVVPPGTYFKVMI